MSCCERRPLRDVVAAALVAITFSGAPSTAHALVTGRPLLEGTRAAGTLLGRPGLVRGLTAHALASLWWTALLSLAVPRRGQIPVSMVAGYLIARLDIDVIAPRRYPAIATLHRGAQVADHVAFGALVGATFRLRDSVVKCGQ